eukprot:TRINITY_DN3571_c0_g4_i3.p1 TRINITY_DN3571_c0_g4~~TRINITY_DN3571_c0_g4_i3.p1  ORF type:complete len:248 (-),score=19.32 TRINITY_DN3571_c0_g4_i3:605-1348(-)
MPVLLHRVGFDLGDHETTREEEQMLLHNHDHEKRCTQARETNPRRLFGTSLVVLVGLACFLSGTIVGFLIDGMGDSASSTENRPDPRPRPSCSEAKVALCMTGNHFAVRQDFNLNQHFLTAVIEPLGGVDNVDVYISSDPEVVDTVSYRVLMGMLHNKTQALNTWAKLTQPGSLGFGILRKPTDHELMAAGNCSYANDGNLTNVSVYSPVFMLSSYVQQFRVDQCMTRVLDQEAACGRLDSLSSCDR